MYFSIITNQILILSFLAIIGVIATKVKVISEEVKNSIAAIVFNITLPALIITSISNIEINREILQNSIMVFIFSNLGVILLYFTGKISRKIHKIKDKKGNIHVIHTMLGNVAFLGYPLFSALFPGGEGLFYAVIYHLTQDIYIWTIGVYEFKNSKNLSFRDSIKNLINPNIVAFVTGIVMLSVGIKLPDYFNQPISGLGKTTIYLAMLYIGAVLAQNTMLTAFKKKEIYALIFNKMLLIPVFILLVFHIISTIFNVYIGDIAKTVVAMQVAMPCMTIVVVLAKRFGSDDIYATENFFLATIFSFVTLPFIYYLSQII